MAAAESGHDQGQSESTNPSPSGSGDDQKKNQTWHQRTASELAAEFEAKGDAKVRGEITLVIAGLTRGQDRQRQKAGRRDSRC